MNLKKLFLENWRIIISLIILLSFLIFVISISSKEAVKKRKKKSKSFLMCPIRGILRIKKYDSKGNYSEEYQRIRLIKYFLQKGYAKKQFIIEYAIPIGHKGHNSLRVDLAIKKENKFFLVSEIKKCYNKENMKSAIKHQLIPAMQILNSKYGIYFDGTKKSRLIIRNSDGTLAMRHFP